MEHRVKCLIFSSNNFVNSLEKAAFARSFLYGDGVITSFWLKKGKFPFWEEHQKRLTDSAKVQFGIDISDFVHNFFNKLKLEFTQDLYLRITLSFDTREYDFLNRSFRKEDIFAIIHFEEKELVIKNIDCTTHKINYPQFDVKQALYAKQLRILGNDVPIFYDENGFIEAISSNLFLEKNGKLYTPSHSKSLNGIIKQKIIEKFNVIQEPIQSLDGFNSGFLTNSVKLFQIIESVDSKAWSKPKMLSIIYPYFENLYEECN